MSDPYASLGLPSVISDIDGLPLPPAVKRSLWKSIGRLIGSVTDLATAIVEHPTARIEAKTDAVRATAEARRIAKIEMAKIVPTMIAADENLSSRAVAYVGHEMIAEQANREGVLQHAIEDLRSAPPEEDPGSEIDDDWLHAFIKEASTKSAPDMQLLFGKILSGEIKRPGTFSLRAVRTLSMMSQTTAKQFEKFCNLSIAAANFVMVIALKAQLKYELDFETLSNLNENDLIYGDFNIPLDFAPLLVPRMGRPAETDPFEYAGETVWLHATDVTKIDALRQVNSAMFSRTGIELRRIVSMQPDPSYTLELIEYFDTRGCDLMKATGRNEDGHLIGRRYRDDLGGPPPHLIGSPRPHPRQIGPRLRPMSASSAKRCSRTHSVT